MLPLVKQLVKYTLLKNSLKYSHGVSRKTLSYCPGKDCDAHMNELPIPCGPWEPWYKAKQNLYNKVFVGGVLWFLFSCAMMILTDSIYFNFSPPPLPGPPSDMIVDCEDD